MTSHSREPIPPSDMDPRAGDPEPGHPPGKHEAPESGDPDVEDNLPPGRPPQ